VKLVLLTGGYFDEEVPQMVASPGHRGTNRNRWIPLPLTLVVAMVVGYALFVYVTLDQNLGKPPVAKYGWPVTYRVEPRNVYAAPNTPSQFYPAAVFIDISVALGLLASTCFTTQFLLSLRGRTPRYTLRMVCLWIAAIALLLAMWRYARELLLLGLVAALCYGLASPVLMVIILLRRPLAKLFSSMDRLLSRLAG
jgi:hypothetical protein